MPATCLELEQEHVERDDSTPDIGHFSDDPEKRVALCGTRILGIPVGEPYVMCVVCLELWDFTFAGRRRF